MASTLVIGIPAGTHTGTYRFTVTGTEHDHSRSVAASVVVTNDNPTATAPVITAYPKSSLGTTSLQARVSWAAATDPSSPIGGYEIQASIDGFSVQEMVRGEAEVIIGLGPPLPVIHG